VRPRSPLYFTSTEGAQWKTINLTGIDSRPPISFIATPGHKAVIVASSGGRPIVLSTFDGGETFRHYPLNLP
jgi:hypothetical protein